MNKNKFKKVILILVIEFLLGAIFLFGFMKYFLKISFYDAIPVIIIGLIGFLIGCVYYLKKIEAN